MRFGISARILSYSGFGVQTYLSNLIPALENCSQNHEIVVFHDSSTQGKGENWKCLSPTVGSLATRFAWDHVSVPLACKRFHIDALLAPAHVPPLWSSCPSVVVVHDMMYHLFPAQWSLTEGIYFRWGVNLLTKHASRIIADSRATAADLKRIVGVSENKIQVIYPGVAKDCYPLYKIGQDRVLEKLGIDGPFLLSVSSAHPRKNLSVLIDSFSRVSQSFPEIKLVMTGPRFGDYSGLIREIRSSPASERIMHVGLVEREDLMALYSAARLFVFPSLYEGFGFPVLEAMACGCPVLAINNSSIPEVAGNAALLIDDASAEGITRGIAILLNDATRLEQLKHQGLERSTQFSWDTCAKTILSALIFATENNKSI